MLEQYEDMVGGARVKLQDRFMATGWIVLNEKHLKSFRCLLKRIEKDRKLANEDKAMINKISNTERVVDGYVFIYCPATKTVIRKELTQ